MNELGHSLVETGYAQPSSPSERFEKITLSENDANASGSDSLDPGVNGSDRDDERDSKQIENKKKEPDTLERPAGHSTLPMSRVQKILKADEELPTIAKEAAFIISLAAEEFIKRLSEAAQRVAERERRTTVQSRDLATVIRKADEFVFLEELVPFLMSPSASTPSSGKRGATNLKSAKPGLNVKDKSMLLEQFVKVQGPPVNPASVATDVVMKELSGINHGE